MLDWHFYVYHPFGQALALLAIAIVLMAVLRHRAGAIGVVVTTFYVVASPIYNAAMATKGWGWWWLTLISLGSFFVLLLVVALVSGKLSPKGKETGGGTAFVLPVVIYPPLLFITGLVRLVIWLVRE
ncbi:MAG: hypothetical protein ACAI43_12340 [Phycisphaerae bacterium]